MFTSNAARTMSEFFNTVGDGRHLGSLCRESCLWGINGACLRVERRRREGISQGGGRGGRQRERERARRRDDHAKPSGTDVLTQGCVEVSCSWQYSPSHLSAWKRRRDEALTGLLIVRLLNLVTFLRKPYYLHFSIYLQNLILTEFQFPNSHPV